jgi:hypothetical protein
MTESVRYRQRPDREHLVSPAEKRQLERLGLLVETTATTPEGARRAAENTPAPGSEGSEK